MVLHRFILYNYYTFSWGANGSGADDGAQMTGRRWRGAVDGAQKTQDDPEYTTENIASPNLMKLGLSDGNYFDKSTKYVSKETDERVEPPWTLAIQIACNLHRALL